MTMSSTAAPGRDGAQRGIIDSVHRDWRNLP
jgi:hypothetical protein